MNIGLYMFRSLSLQKYYYNNLTLFLIFILWPSGSKDQNDYRASTRKVRVYFFFWVSKRVANSYSFV